ncbi:MAG: HlyD family efflux transporter periplasmic adaptor subunit [Bacillota bacterium]|nr:HlyD family efflux transporter periplasmic adaptor subunit [Bacillota bacterium]
MTESTKKRNLFILKIVLWLLAVCIVTGIAYFIPGISGALTSTYIAEFDNVFVSDKVDCFLVKNEKVTYSDKSGSVSYSVEEGTHVRKFTGVAKVGADVYTAEQPGMISFTADGYETYFTEENLMNITRDEAESFDIVKQNLVKTEASSGEPLFKAVDDKEWYLIFWIDKDEINEYIKNKSVSVVIEDKIKVSAVISDIYDQENEYMVVLKSREYYADLAEKRKVSAEVITVDEAGLLIRQKSIVTVDDNPGVYVKKINGDYKFVRVKILTLVDENAIVASGSFTETVDDAVTQVTTINSYDEILKNPKSIGKGGESVE